MTVYLPGFEGERKAIEEYFTDAWLDGPYALVPLAYDNIPFVSPKPPDPYVELVIRPASSDQVSLGDDPLLLFTGLVLATAHVPAGEGTKEGRAFIDYVGGLLSRHIIENVASGRITFSVTNIDFQGLEPNPAWYAVASSTRYRRHKTASEG